MPGSATHPTAKPVSSAGKGLRWLFVCGSAAVALFTALAAIGENAPGSALAAVSDQVLPLAQPNLEVAEAIANDPRRRADLPEAERLAQKARAAAPDRLRGALVTLDVGVARDGGRLTPTTLGLLEQSYRLAPLDFNYGANRVVFAYNHWQELTPEVRAMVARETDCLDSGARLSLQEATPRVRTAMGQAALDLNLRKARRGVDRCKAIY